MGHDSYFEVDKNNKKRPQNKLLLPSPPKLSQAGMIEHLRRSSKLLLHEFGHLYVLDHCIYFKCLMVGTGHLVEDFDAPMHLCGIRLRKLRWRLGFSFETHYSTRRLPKP
jgi:hypothetical protein